MLASDWYVGDCTVGRDLERYEMVRPASLDVALERQARLLRAHCQRALAGDLAVYVELRKQRMQLTRAYHSDLMYRRAIRRAHDAWHAERYCECAKWLRSIESLLSDSDRVRLRLADRRCGAVGEQ